MLKVEMYYLRYVDTWSKIMFDLDVSDVTSTWLITLSDILTKCYSFNVFEDQNFLIH